MGANTLEDAASSLRQAAAVVESSSARERLDAQADAFESIADASRGPDHGKLARHEHIITEIAEDHPAAAEHIDAALESIRAYRETLPGV